MFTLTVSATNTTDDFYNGTETTIMETAKDTSGTDITTVKGDTTVPGVETSSFPDVTTAIRQETSDDTDTGTISTGKTFTTTVMPETSEADDKATAITDKTTSENPYSLFSDLDVCDCPDLETTMNCTCTAKSGIIQTTSVDLGQDSTVTYWIDIGEPASIILYFLKEDFGRIGDQYCRVNIGGTEITQLDETNMKATGTKIPIVVTGWIPLLCKYKFRYFTYNADVIINILNSTEGSLTPPEDEYGLFGYRPFTQVLWILQPDIPVSDFVFDIDYVDLGAEADRIHTDENTTSTAGDFLLIGTGAFVLSGNEQMFFGQSGESGINNFITLGEVSHVFFRSTSSIFNATGFNVTYIATAPDPTTTPQPTSTQNPPPPEEVETTYVVSINGAPVDISILNETTKAFQTAMAEMSSKYVKMHGITIKDEITPSSVEVYEMTTCNIVHCNPTCVAFNFSVAALTLDDAWVFTAPVLEDMLLTSELQDALQHIGDDCMICNENPERNPWLYIGIPVGIVVVGILISMVLWYTGGKTNLEESRRKYEQEIADRRDDNRRRSSGDVSILGVGGSIASRGSRSSRHYSMPFPMAKKNNDDGDEDDDGDKFDLSEFTEFDPDLGRVNPSEFGMTNYWHTKHNMGYYGNPSFVDDDNHERTIYDRQESVATAAETDSEDSDGGAVSFTPPIRMMDRPTTSTTFQAEVDVHTYHDSDPVSVMEDTGETVL